MRSQRCVHDGRNAFGQNVDLQGPSLDLRCLYGSRVLTPNPVISPLTPLKLWTSRSLLMWTPLPTGLGRALQPRGASAKPLPINSLYCVVDTRKQCQCHCEGTGAYVRILSPYRCVLRSEAVSRLIQRPFNLSMELEPIMPSFKGNINCRTTRLYGSLKGKPIERSKDILAPAFRKANSNRV